MILQTSLLSQPKFRYARNFFSNSDNNTRAMVADRIGFVYCLNEYHDTVDVDPGPAVQNFTTANQGSRYLVKLDPNGKLVWAKEFENSQSLYVTELHLSQENYLYLTGWGDNQIDFDLGTGTVNKSGGFYSPFVLKLDTSGNFYWLREFPGTGNMLFHALTVDNSGNVIFGGTMNTLADFDPGPNTFTLGPYLNDNFRSILVSLNNSGDFNWAKQVTSGTLDFCLDLTTDLANNIYASGVYNGSILNEAGKPVDTASGSNGFVVKFSTNGKFIWGRQFKSNYGFSRVLQVAVTRDNELYCGGDYQEDIDADPSFLAVKSFTCANSNCSGCFVTKLDSNGNFDWGKNIPAVRLKNFQTDFDKNLYIWANNYAGIQSELISCNQHGATNWSLTIPESLTNEYCYRQLVVQDTSIYLAGTFDKPSDFDPSSNNFTLSTKKNNVFVLRLSQKVNVAPPITTDVEQNKPELLYIWPNPANQIIHIKSDLNGSFSVLDIRGREVCKFNIEPNVNQDIKLSPGMYLIRLQTHKTRVIKKIIVE
jgi:hypothetical protein